MFETYRPRKFCTEFVAVRGHSTQLTSIMAVILGLKPCTDDWVPVKAFGIFARACRRYGLRWKVDSVFRMADPRQVSGDVIGRERLNTTHAYGYPAESQIPNGFCHVFMALNKKALMTCWKDGWYPQIIKGRVIDRPAADLFRFGAALGYPSCCTEFFRHRNNWSLFNFLYEVFKNSGAGPYPVLCNSLARERTYSYVAHMPCSFCCDRTRALAGRIRSAIASVEPLFVKAIDEHLSLPYLVFRERRIYGFEGRLNGQRLHYKKVHSVGQSPRFDETLGDLTGGDTLFLEKGDVVVCKRGRCLRRIPGHEEMRPFGEPFLVQFS